MPDPSMPNKSSSPEPSLSLRVAGNIAIQRKKAGLTQSQVGRLLDLEKETVSRIESGKISINLERLQELSLILGCSVMALIMGEIKDTQDEAAAIAGFLHPLPAPERRMLLRLVEDTARMFSQRES